jgi:WASH complex subunit 7
VCLDSISGAGIVSPEDECIAHESVELLEALCRYRKCIQDQCDTSFLFLARELFPVCLSEIYARPNEAGRLNALMSAFRSCETLLMRGGAKPDEMASFQYFIENSLEREIIQPLCRDIETDLRMHLHSARIIGIASVNPFKDGVRDLSSFTNLPPIRMLNYQVSFLFI